MASIEDPLQGKSKIVKYWQISKTNKVLFFKINLIKYSEQIMVRFGLSSLFDLLSSEREK